MSISEATSLAKLTASLTKPDDEIRQSWFFTLMGRTTAAVLLVFGYLAALGAIYGIFGEDLKKLHAEHPLFFYGAIGAPLLLVLIFSVIPTIRRGIRERRLYPLSQRETDQTEGYYRLRPYDEADAEDYTRPDGALEDALAWLKAADKTVLYLSGASGTGKSSLINAGIVPALRQEDWRILQVRGMGDPMAALDTALRSEPGLFHKPPAPEATIPDMLAAIAAEAERTQSAPLLIVLDQFEEYLILDSSADKTAYADLLRTLDQTPVPGVHMLHVFRSDYWEVLFKEGLPENIPRQTGFGLAPFNRAEAESFLRGGDQQLDDRGYDALFAGLDRIEDARGIYRPITLNMVGYMLGQQGRTLAVDPGRLIESYLTSAIAKGQARDFAPAVLQAMITREGTKQVQTVDAIAERTQIKPWQVQGTLRELEGDRLVRPLPQGLWEISHDFLARLIGPVLGRTRTGWIWRHATPVLAFALIG